ncbi:type IX secretion system anionic LPS delivery protein PorZ [Arcicella rigui]|uniref:Two-component regulator propeller domain-containing protein n=1 Tax=Arcicella rigui TaxID=797020 RepID=A0ABU5Q940_9BACT|nr:two-component regulator propeller domain-containing protein [Arcicella rigui]MEA5139356.1 two-component regulator propeller domain-containing protein [Arcicella rigui]
MKKIPYFLLITCLVFLTNKLNAQTPIGTWQTYFNYAKAKQVLVLGNKIYCISENGFFYYDTSENQAITLSKIDGLSEVGIAKIHYVASRQSIIIAYTSGNIDILSLSSTNEPLEISNISLLKESTIQGSKGVNHIASKDNLAYLSYNFGLVVLDVAKQDIKETYQNLGDKGSSIEIYKTAFANDSIYLATSVGIRKAKYASNVNLQYFGNWSTLYPVKSTLSTWQNGILVADNSGKIFSYQNGKSTNLIDLSNKIDVLEILQANKYWVLTGTSSNILDLSQNTYSSFGNANIKAIKDLQVDAQGKYWLADYQNGLMSNSEGSFKSYSPQSLDTLYQNRKDSVVADTEGNLWIRGSVFGGILVKNSSNQQKYISTGIGYGNLPSSNVKTLVLDKDGQMWTGTDKGVVVFDSPSNVFSGSNFDAYTPIYEKRRLLGNETVNTIAVDGGNRKWMGTNNGLFLFSSDGTSLVSQFTESDSPLPSNEILYVKTDSKGEVFIRTSKGLVSYRGTATESTSLQSENTVKVFPNPVRPDFEGTIGIEGLVENAFVKITDIAGNLIYETQANGGTATWNGKTLAGKKAETGIYLIFSGNAKGEETLVNRLVIVK